MPVEQHFTIVHPAPDPKEPVPYTWVLGRESAHALYEDLRAALGIPESVVQVPVQSAYVPAEAAERTLEGQLHQGEVSIEEYLAARQALAGQLATETPGHTVPPSNPRGSAIGVRHV